MLVLSAMLARSVRCGTNDIAATLRVASRLLSRTFQSHSYRGSWLNVELITEPGAAWEACEASLDARGDLLPLFIGPSGESHCGRGRQEFSHRDFAVPTAGAGRLAFESSRSRALPSATALSPSQTGIGSGGVDNRHLKRDSESLRRSRPAIDRAARHRDAFANERELALALRRLSAVGIFARCRDPELRANAHARSGGLGKTLVWGLHKNARGASECDEIPVRLATAESYILLRGSRNSLMTLGSEQVGNAAIPIGAPSSRMSRRAPNLSRIAILERTDRGSPGFSVGIRVGRHAWRVAEYSEIRLHAG